MTTATIAEHVPIATFQDILNAMARNPELKEQMRQHLQDEELRNLPQTVARLEQAVAELTVIVQGIAQRQERTEADVADIKAGQVRHDADIAELKAGQVRHDADIAELKAGQARIEIIQDDMRGQLVHLAARRMTGRIANITQSSRPRWLESTDIVDIADDADTDAVPPNELDSFRDIDLALIATDKTSADGQQQYVIIECSGTITHRDITRIARNAEHMTRFTGLPCQAVVVGYTIPDHVAEAARHQAVHWLPVTIRATHPR